MTLNCYSYKKIPSGIHQYKLINFLTRAVLDVFLVFPTQAMGVEKIVQAETPLAPLPSLY